MLLACANSYFDSQYFYRGFAKIPLANWGYIAVHNIVRRQLKMKKGRIKRKGLLNDKNDTKIYLFTYRQISVDLNFKKLKF